MRTIQQPITASQILPRVSQYNKLLVNKLLVNKLLVNKLLVVTAIAEMSIRMEIRYSMRGLTPDGPEFRKIREKPSTNLPKPVQYYGTEPEGIRSVHFCEFPLSSTEPASDPVVTW